MFIFHKYHNTWTTVTKLVKNAGKIAYFGRKNPQVMALMVTWVIFFELEIFPWVHRVK